MKEKPIKGKVIFAYLVLLAVIMSMAAILLYERRTTREIEAVSHGIRIVHNEISTVHHRITELAMRGEAALSWTDTDYARYDSLLQETDTMLQGMKKSCVEYMQPSLVDSVCLQLRKKGEHLKDFMWAVRDYDSSDTIFMERLPIAVRRATEVKTVTRKKSGLAGLFGGKKKVRVQPTMKAKQLLTKLNEELISNHEERQKEIKAYTDSLRISNGKLNERLSVLLTELDMQTQKAISVKEERIAEARTRTFYLLAAVAILATALLAILTVNIRREMKRRRREKMRREELIGELQASNEQKEEVIATRRMIIQTVTHELRTPLTVVKGNAGLIVDGEDMDMAKRHAEMIGSEAKRMSAMVNSLLDYFRLDSGKETLEENPFDIGKIGETLEMEYSPLTAEKHLDFIVENNAKGIVCGDMGKMVMIGGNLLSNAIKFTKHGMVSLRTIYTDNMFTMEVEDTGTGIPKEKQDRIFKPFERLGNAATKDGFGLGLAIAHNMVTLLGGNITVESEKGKGSKFTVAIPLRPVSETIEEVPVEECLSRNTVHCDVLMIDDSDMVLATVHDMLVKHSVRCDTCINADGLTEKLREKDYDIVMTDLKMPEIDGYDILELLRMTNVGNSRTVPVMAMTASGSVSEDELLSAGFNGVVFKPFSEAELLNAIGKCVNVATKNVEPDLSALLAFGDCENVLQQLIDETNTDMERLKNAASEQDKEALSDILHHLRSSWMLIKAEKPLRLLNEALKADENIHNENENEIGKAISEILGMGEKVITMAQQEMAGKEMEGK